LTESLVLPHPPLSTAPLPSRGHRARLPVAPSTSKPNCGRFGPKEDETIRLPSHLPRRRAVQILLALALLPVFLVAAPASARETTRLPDGGPVVKSMRAYVAHYRSVTWAYQRAAHARRTPTSYADRRTTDTTYLRWTVERWTRRAYGARRAAVARIERRLSVDLPPAPALHARLAQRVAYSRRLTLRLRRIYPGTVSARFAHSARRTGRETLRLWQRRSALAAVEVAEHGAARPVVPDWLNDAFLCIHRYEGAWNSNTGNGYYGGLQMDMAFQGLYGTDYLRRWGTADNWPAWAQVQAAVRAHRSGRGFGPWPNTARACGLL